MLFANGNRQSLTHQFELLSLSHQAEDVGAVADFGDGNYGLFTPNDQRAADYSDAMSVLDEVYEGS